MVKEVNITQKETLIFSQNLLLNTIPLNTIMRVYFDSTTSLPEGPMCLASRPGSGSHVEVSLNGSTVEVHVVVLPHRVEVCHDVHGHQTDPTGHQMHPQGVEHVPNGLLSENAC